MRHEHLVAESARRGPHASAVVQSTGSLRAAALSLPHRGLTPKAQPQAVSVAEGHNPTDPSAEERVRAWYQARSAAQRAEATASSAASTSPVVQPTIPAANAPAAVESSTADDAAAIHEESHIPSTAPTERVPAPFTHGDIVNPMPSATISALKPRAAGLPAGLAGAAPATLHGPAPAAAAVASASAKSKLDPELADTLAREAFDGSDGSLSGKPAAVVLGSTANTKLATRPGVAVLDEAPALRGEVFIASGRLIAPMRGSHDILVHQNQMAVADGLLRVANDTQLAGMQRNKLLVALPDTASMQPDGRLPLNRRYARPWTVHFLNDLARAHYARFGTPLVITSAVRTVAFQRHLVLVNGNAAPPTGDIASPHLYGQAIDLAKHGMSIAEIAWMRAWLTPIESEGKIDVEEEFLQSCFHISVYRRYAPEPARREMPAVEEAPARRLQQAKAVPARRRHISTALLAAGLR